MTKDRARLKVVLLQFRRDDAKKEKEYSAFQRATGLPAEQLRRVDVERDGVSPSDLDGASALIIGGSSRSVFDPMDFMEDLAAAVRAAKEKRLPTLGICFGAQLIAHVFGGRVVRDKEHEEFGTYDIETTDDSLTDMVFADVPFRFPAQCAHQDRIAALPPSAITLATSERCGVQAFVIPGTDIYGVQFHPERSKADFEALLATAGADYSELSKRPIEEAKASLKETPDAEAIVGKFLDRIVLQR
jgi:GMP synthase (glutamine-hydrolysing)